MVVHPTPKNSKCKNLLEKFSHRFFGIKTAGPNYQGGVLLISDGAIEGRLKRKTSREGHQWGLFLHDYALANPTLAIQ